MTTNDSSNAEASFDRRRFLGVAVAAGAMSAGGLGVWRLLEDRDPDDGARLRGIGRAYLAAYPDESTPAALLARAPELRGRWTASRFGTLRGAVARDFRDGSIVIVDGWRLATTEARAAALLVLTEH